MGNQCFGSGSYSLDVLYGGLGTSKLQFLIIFSAVILLNLVIKTLDSDWIRINESESETLWVRKEWWMEEWATLPGTWTPWGQAWGTRPPWEPRIWRCCKCFAFLPSEKKQEIKMKQYQQNLKDQTKREIIVKIFSETIHSWESITYITIHTKIVYIKGTEPQQLCSKKTYGTAHHNSPVYLIVPNVFKKSGAYVV